MRELKRSIARAHMLDAGAKRINKLRTNGRSYFSTYWKFWFVYDPNDKRRNKRNEKIINRILETFAVRKTVKGIANG